MLIYNRIYERLLRPPFGFGGTNSKTSSGGAVGAGCVSGVSSVSSVSIEGGAGGADEGDSPFVVFVR
jgi:hypothetical protein